MERSLERPEEASLGPQWEFELLLWDVTKAVCACAGVHTCAYASCFMCSEYRTDRKELDASGRA